MALDHIENFLGNIRRNLLNMDSYQLRDINARGIEHRQFESSMRGQPVDEAHTNAFENVMDGFIVRPGPSHEPSGAARWLHAPAAAYDRVMASLDQPAPAGMPVLQAMEFYARKQIDLNEAKTLQNVVATVAKLAKKNLETVLNNK